MPELRTAEPPSRSLLIRSASERMHHVVHGFRPVAEELLADASRIDVFGVAGDGSAVIALLAERADESLVLLARGLAQREWLTPRLPDWLKLAPDLGVQCQAPVQLVLLAPAFVPEALAAARAVDRVPLHLATWRFVRNGSEAGLLLESLASASFPSRAIGSDPSAPQSGFRTGLSDADLGLSADERAEFE